MVEIKFKIGEIVTIKSHPLAYQENGEIDSHINHIPPFMCVKEIHIEHKKLLFSQDDERIQIADNVKYVCTYFNQHRMIFEDKQIYQALLSSLDEMKFHSDTKKKEDDHTLLVDETKEYTLSKYKFGEIVFFKTYKLEKRKKFKSFDQITKDNKKDGEKNDTIKPKGKSAITHTSPAFVMSGFKSNEQKSIYNQKDGKLQRKCSEKLVKVIWYNSYQEKFSEEWLPIEFLTDDEKIYKSTIKKQPN